MANPQTLTRTDSGTYLGDDNVHYTIAAVEMPDVDTLEGFNLDLAVAREVMRMEIPEGVDETQFNRYGGAAYSRRFDAAQLVVQELGLMGIETEINLTTSGGASATATLSGAGMPEALAPSLTVTTNGTTAAAVAVCRAAVQVARELSL